LIDCRAGATLPDGESILKGRDDLQTKHNLGMGNVGSKLH
jgi:hypothetical protein